MTFKPGDVILIKEGIFWQGENIGGRLGTVDKIKSYIYVNVYDCENNPVKCLSYEIESADLIQEDIDLEEELNDFFNKTFPS